MRPYISLGVKHSLNQIEKIVENSTMLDLLINSIKNGAS